MISSRFVPETVITICLDDTVSDEDIINLLTISYDLTKNKI